MLAPRERSPSTSSSPSPARTSIPQDLSAVPDSIHAHEAQHRSDTIEDAEAQRSSTESDGCTSLINVPLSFANSLPPHEDFSAFADATMSNPSGFDPLEALQLADQDFLGLFDNHVMVPKTVHELTSMMNGHNYCISASPTYLSNPAKSWATDHIREEKRTFVLNDDEYETVKMMAAHLQDIPRLCDFKLPSKFAISRFVSAFFEYAAPLLPIVHAPTFSIATTPHGHGEFQLWMLQASILVCHFEAFGEQRDREAVLNQNFSDLVGLVDDALTEVKALQETTYREWVKQETLNRQPRCIAASTLLSAAFLSGTPSRRLPPVVQQPKFFLPCPTVSWLQDEKHWARPEEVFYSPDAFSMVLEGQKFSLYDSDFAFATVASEILCHVCLFESICKTHPPELFAGFSQKMDGPVRILGEIWKEQLAGQLLIGSTMTPMAHLTRSIMLSLSFHVFASDQLMAMKRLLFATGPSDSYECTNNRLDDSISATIEGALVMAAEMLRSDCRTGLGYIKTCGYLRFGPMAGIAAYEAGMFPATRTTLSTSSLSGPGLLLCWYLQTKKSGLTPESALDRLISEAMSEVERQQVTTPVSISTFPLMVYARLFDDALWEYDPSFTSSFA
ncbi:hypothetical protein FDECE_16001 [Fusarium decemcellulare]|nr:hypothetical protein FDECE_16001 [Fusarium decemcellulare]